MTFVKTALFHKAGEGSGGGGGGDQHNLGWYATESALTTAHATATDGDWAIVGATDTVWVWDSDSTGWKDTGAAGIELPDQTGKSGEFLTTDGSSASWTNWRNRPFTNTATKYDCIGIQTAATITGGGEHNILIGSGISRSPRNGRVSDGYAVAIGGNSSSVTVGAHGVAIGAQANFNGGTLTGYDLDCCVAVGFNSYTRDQYSTAIGASAGAKGFGSIQLGYGENTNARTLSVGFITSFSPWAAVNYELLSADGTIPEARLADTTNAQQGDVLTLDSTGNAVWQAGGGGSSPRKNEVFLSPSDWNYDSGEGGYLQVVNVTGVTSQSVVFVAPAPFPQEQQNYASAGVMCVQQGNGTLTFFSPNGSNDMLDVYVVVFN